ncbi:MAG: hypothetical protein DSZ32_03705 [Gammaproteobacteria bacterium]|nr:MAG: hypothetical protein DSZ32_03705 [Gammaproteobacteria bacterium]
MQSNNRYSQFIVMFLLILLSPASWARHGAGEAYQQSAVYQDEVEQMVETYQDFLDRHPYRQNRKLRVIEAQLDRLNGAAIKLARNLRKGHQRRARVNLDTSRRIARNTSMNLNAIRVTRPVRAQWRRVVNALNRIRLREGELEYGSGYLPGGGVIPGLGAGGGIIPGLGGYALGNGRGDDDGDDSREVVPVQPQSSGSITGLVDQIEDLSERVKNTFRKTSKRRQSWEKTLDGQLSGFDQLANQLRDRWKSRHTATSIRATVNALKQKSVSIHGIISRYPVNARVRSHWLNLKSRLDQLDGMI